MVEIDACLVIRSAGFFGRPVPRKPLPRSLPTTPHDRRRTRRKMLPNLSIYPRKRRHTLGLQAWHAIDKAERAAGVATGRPQVTIADQQELTEIANAAEVANASK